MPLSPFALRNSTASMSRSALAVVMGYLTTVVLVVGSFTLIALCNPDLLLAAKPSNTLLISTLIVSWLAAVPAGYVTARLSEKNEYVHTGILVCVLIVLDWVTIFMEAGAKPIWWHLSLQVGLIPFLFLGAWLHVRNKPEKSWWPARMIRSLRSDGKFWR